MPKFFSKYKLEIYSALFIVVASVSIGFAHPNIILEAKEEVATLINPSNQVDLAANNVAYLENKPSTPIEASPSPSPLPSPSPSILPTPSSKPSVTPSPKPSVTPSPAPVVNNNPPASGYSRQSVSTDSGVFSVSIVSADLGNTKVIVDTASSSDCANDCPVLALGDYVTRNGAFAGINGSYFCPATYPQCAGKTNSFDTLLMNKDKYYFNSGNNVYSNVPAAIFSTGSARFISSSSQWGRDTGVDAVIANHPLMVFNKSINFAGGTDPKQTSRGPRGFIANRGSTVYIGIVHSAAVHEAAKVLQAMGMDNALDLDSGGSTALWYGGYKAGPGRQIPNAILFVRR